MRFVLSVGFICKKTDFCSILQILCQFPEDNCALHYLEACLIEGTLN